MKTIAILSALLITLAAGAQITDGFITKFLDFSVKKVLAEQVFDKVWDRFHEENFKTSAYQGYRKTRGTLYESLGLQYDGENVSMYLQGRTIIMTQIKGYFFNGENLKEMYLEIQPRYRAELEKMGLAEKTSLSLKLEEVKLTFEMMLKPQNQDIYWNWYKTITENPTVENIQFARSLIFNNVPAEEIVKKIKAGELSKPILDKWEVEEQVFKAYPDIDLAQFAGRRWKDGGDNLLRKYIEVIDLAIADIK